MPPLHPDWLAGVKDGQPIGTAGKNEPESEAYCDALRKAWQSPPGAFALVARRDLTYAHLFEEPATYRGQVVHIKGRLARVRRYEAPLTVKDLGAEYLYEAWIFDQRYQNNPWCVLCIRLPAGIDIGEKLDYPVTFDGYFFKRYRFKAGDSVKPEQGREVPLLIGPTLTLIKQPPALAETAAGWSPEGIPFILTLIALVAILVIGLAWWYRRGDRHVRSRLAARSLQFVEPEQAAGPDQDTSSS